MGQNFAQFKDQLHARVLRDDLSANYGDYINQALREIQNRRSWTFMKNTVQPVTIPPSDGNATADLPADFKELQRRTAVEFIADDGGYIPAELVTEEQQIFRIWAFGGTPITTWPPRVFLLRESTAKLGMIEPLIEPFSFRVKYFRFLPDLVNDTDTSPFIDAYPRMVFSKARAIAFDDINDPIAESHEEMFEKKLREAIAYDAHGEYAGVTTRMGQGI